MSSVYGGKQIVQMWRRRVEYSRAWIQWKIAEGLRFDKP